MIKILLFVFIFINSFHCALFDTLGMSYPEAVKGSEAKDIILHKAIMGASMDADSRDNVYSFIADKLAGIEIDAYYDKKAVDRCAEEAMLINLLSLDIGGLHCDLKKHKVLINWPIPAL
ncbi:MAG: TIGR04452 family lipoprotein [Leptospiraceae bacterium]|nr:TIGR04452 family lipoprotein [Leptospiraceae bacterium]MCP5499136.1 TIGR04452 family lipoprotein [Leptospiraceae bacterium]